jgi:acyl dehydratase
MEITEKHAQVIARALIVANKKFAEEFEKIANTPDVSNFIVEAAHNQYQELTNDMTRLHMELADAFPVLRQA